MKLPDQILDAMNDVGDDLVDMAEGLLFPKPRWRKIAPLAACLAALLGLGAAAWFYLPRMAQPMENTALSQSVTEEPDILPPAEDVLPLEKEAWIWEPEPLPFYVLERSDWIVGPAVAVDNQGNILVETEQGTISPLIDQETGEYLAIVVDLQPDTVPQPDNRLLIYDLEGNLVQELTACSIFCVGDVVMVNGYDTAALYSRSSGEMILDGLESAYPSGNCVRAVPADGGDQYLLLDGTGVVTARIGGNQEIMADYVWNGETYICLMDGIMDSHGNWVVEPAGGVDMLSFSRGYAVYRQEEHYFVVDVESGEVMLEWPFLIAEVFEQGAVVYLENGCCAVRSWQGEFLTGETGSIWVQDDEGDGTPELLALHGSDNVLTLLRLDGTVQLELDMRNAGIMYLSSRTALYVESIQDESGAWVMDFALIDLETGAENRNFSKPYSSGVPVWYGREDGSSYTTGLLCAQYQDEDGEYHTDLLREDGAVLLEDLTDYFTAYAGGGVYALERDGMRILARLDGSILYQEPAE